MPTRFWTFMKNLRKSNIARLLLINIFVHSAYAVAGDVPPELLSDEAVQWPQVRIVTGSGDDWYTPAVMRKDVSALEAAGARVSASVFEGGHEWTNEVNEAAAALLAEFGARPGSIP